MIRCLKKIFTLGAMLSPAISLAQTQYVPLAPLFSGQGQPVTAQTYLPNLFRYGIGIAAGLAVIVIAYAGLRYMLSDVVTSKSGAVDMIKNALAGLLLALCSYLLLRTINPDLVSLNFAVQQRNVNVNSIPGGNNSRVGEAFSQLLNNLDTELSTLNTQFAQAEQQAAQLREQARQKRAEANSLNPSDTEEAVRIETLRGEADDLDQQAGSLIAFPTKMSELVNQERLILVEMGINPTSDAKSAALNAVNSLRSQANALTTTSTGLTQTQLDAYKARANQAKTEIDNVVSSYAQQ